MPIVIAIAVAFIVVVYLKDSSSTSNARKTRRSSNTRQEIHFKKPDEILRNKKHGHFGVVMKKTRDSNGNSFVETIHMSSKSTDAGRHNIPMKQNADPVKVKRKNILKKKLSKGEITNSQYKKICQDEKLDSYFIKKIRTLPRSEYKSQNYAETRDFELHPDDRKKAKEMYQQHLINSNKEQKKS